MDQFILFLLNVKQNSFSLNTVCTLPGELPMLIDFKVWKYVLLTKISNEKTEDPRCLLYKCLCQDSHSACCISKYIWFEPKLPQGAQLGAKVHFPPEA